LLKLILGIDRIFAFLAIKLYLDWNELLGGKIKIGLKLKLPN
jgi:hypothetical protein